MDFGFYSSLLYHKRNLIQINAVFIGRYIRQFFSRFIGLLEHISLVTCEKCCSKHADNGHNTHLNHSNRSTMRSNFRVFCCHATITILWQIAYIFFSIETATKMSSKQQMPHYTWHCFIVDWDNRATFVYVINLNWMTFLYAFLWKMNDKLLTKQLQQNWKQFRIGFELLKWSFVYTFCMSLYFLVYFLSQ